MAPNLCYESLFYPRDDNVQNAYAFIEDKQNPASTGLHRARKVSLEDVFDENYRSALQDAINTIRIMDSIMGNQPFLQRYHAELHAVPLEVLYQLDAQAPSTLAARVADFNGNLLYEMKTPKELRGVGLEGLVHDALGANDFLGSYLTTESTAPQPAHVDYAWETLEVHPHLYLGFFPLTTDGMYLQVWPGRIDDTTAKQKIRGEILFIPFGRLLVLPAATIHAGGFRTTPFDSTKPGNLRFHLYLARSSDSLPAHQTNKYTEPHDKGRELCERYVDAAGLNVLQKHFFV